MFSSENEIAIRVSLILASKEIRKNQDCDFGFLEQNLPSLFYQYPQEAGSLYGLIASFDQNHHRFVDNLIEILKKNDQLLFNGVITAFIEIVQNTEIESVVSTQLIMIVFTFLSDSSSESIKSKCLALLVSLVQYMVDIFQDPSNLQQFFNVVSSGIGFAPFHAFQCLEMFVKYHFKFFVESCEPIFEVLLMNLHSSDQVIIAVTRVFIRIAKTSKKFELNSLIDSTFNRVFEGLIAVLLKNESIEPDPLETHNEFTSSHEALRQYINAASPSVVQLVYQKSIEELQNVKSAIQVETFMYVVTDSIMTEYVQDYETVFNLFEMGTKQEYPRIREVSLWMFDSLIPILPLDFQEKIFSYIPTLIQILPFSSFDLLFCCTIFINLCKTYKKPLPFFDDIFSLLLQYTHSDIESSFVFSALYELIKVSQSKALLKYIQTFFDMQIDYNVLDCITVILEKVYQHVSDLFEEFYQKLLFAYHQSSASILPCLSRLSLVNKSELQSRIDSFIEIGLNYLQSENLSLIQYSLYGIEFASINSNLNSGIQPFSETLLQIASQKSDPEIISSILHVLSQFTLYPNEFSLYIKGTIELITTNLQLSSDEEFILLTINFLDALYRRTQPEVLLQYKECLFQVLVYAAELDSHSPKIVSFMEMLFGLFPLDFRSFFQNFESIQLYFQSLIEDNETNQQAYALISEILSSES